MVDCMQTRCFGENLVESRSRYELNFFRWPLVEEKNRSADHCSYNWGPLFCNFRTRKSYKIRATYYAFSIVNMKTASCRMKNFWKFRIHPKIFSMIFWSEMMPFSYSQSWMHSMFALLCNFRNGKSYNIRGTLQDKGAQNKGPPP